MKRVLLTLMLLALLAVNAAPAKAESLTVAAGAGYKKLVTDLASSFEAASGKKVELIFGNLGQVTAQAKTSGKIHMIIGEQAFLRQAQVPMGDFTELGRGVLVVAWPKGKAVKDFADLASPGIRRIAMPDAAKATYGKAGGEALARAGLEGAVKDKLLVVATVPQVTTYVLTGEVDAGLTNLTDVMDLGGQIGGFLKVDPALYNPISIGAAVVSGAAHPDLASFSAFLASSKGQELARKHGL